MKCQVSVNTLQGGYKIVDVEEEHLNDFYDEQVKKGNKIIGIIHGNN